MQERIAIHASAHKPRRKSAPKAMRPAHFVDATVRRPQNARETPKSKQAPPSLQACRAIRAGVHHLRCKDAIQAKTSSWLKQKSGL